MIVGLCSTYRDGRLAADAVRSLLDACQSVRVLDGPIGDASEGGNATDWTSFRKEPRVTVAYGAWPTDADKRTDLLSRSRRLPLPTWGLILDGDELLLHGEQIPSLIEHAEMHAAHVGKEPLRIPLRIVESDGAAGVVTGRLLRLDLIERWLISSYHVLLTNGVEASLPNGYFVEAGAPDLAVIETTTGMQMRRPLQGEPHIYHRSHLRPPQREAERQSVAEGSAFDRLVAGAGLLDAHGETARDDRLGIWLPR